MAHEWCCKFPNSPWQKKVPSCCLRGSLFCLLEWSLDVVGTADTDDVYCKEGNCSVVQVFLICVILILSVRVKVKTESQDPTSSWRSLIPVIKVNVSTVSELYYN